MLVTYGSSCEALAKASAKIARLKVLDTIRRRFPDGEQYLRVEGDVKGEDVAVFQSLGLNPDSYFIEYALIVDALRGAGCRSVTAVVPYLAYARQDKRFREGEPLSAKAFARLIERAGTDRIITVDMHLHRFSKISEVFDIPAENVSAMPLIAAHYAKAHRGESVVVVGPDMESKQWAKQVADALSSRLYILEKERLGDREVKVSDVAFGKGSRALLVDDMISTGKTLMEVISKLRSQGFNPIDAAATHSLLVEGAYEMLKEAGMSDLISTDTLPGPHSVVSVAPALARAIAP